MRGTFHDKTIKKGNENSFLLIFPVLSTPLETQNYAYTLQGWIKGVSGQHFSYALGYNNTDYAAIGATPSAALYVLTGGKDLSFGANSWDGVDQAAHDPNSNRMRITVTYLDKNNKEKTQTYTSNALAMGWNISDEHFKTWKESMNSGSGKKMLNSWNKRFGTQGFVAQQQVKGIGLDPYKFNKGVMRKTSTACYGSTIFWNTK